MYLSGLITSFGIARTSKSSSSQATTTNLSTITYRKRYNLSCHGPFQTPEVLAISIPRGRVTSARASLCQQIQPDGHEQVADICLDSQGMLGTLERWIERTAIHMIITQLQINNHNNLVLHETCKNGLNPQTSSYESFSNQIEEQTRKPCSGFDNAQDSSVFCLGAVYNLFVFCANCHRATSSLTVELPIDRSACVVRFVLRICLCVGRDDVGPFRYLLP